MRQIVTVGNCQAKAVGDCAAAMLGGQATYIQPATHKADPALVFAALQTADIVFANTGKTFVNMSSQLYRAGSRAALLAVPRIFFSGFHPDAVFPTLASAERRNPLGNANSALLLSAWRSGLTEAQAFSLFKPEVYRYLSYDAFLAPALKLLKQECGAAGFNVTPLLERWMRNGAFMHQPLHPKIQVLADIAHVQLESVGISVDRTKADDIDDELSRNAVWPIYPEIGGWLGVPGDYVFLPKNMHRRQSANHTPLSLPAFIARSFEVYKASPPDFDAFDRLQDSRYSNLSRFLGRRSSAKIKNDHPYQRLDDSHFWSRSVANITPADVDPVVKPAFTISQNDAIATAGSCFAQHISNRLRISGYNYLVTEMPCGSAPDLRQENYGVFSARYGNIYTTRQLLQLIARAYGDFVPRDNAWALASGGWVDPFRPNIGSIPFETLGELSRSRETHLAAVRQMFETLDVFVFTLGLTEAWRSREDLAVVPLAPGVVGAQCDPSLYEPKNFDVDEIRADLNNFVQKLKAINSRARIILTVSPVPLIATFEDQHVLAATTYSKSVLRVAAGDAARKHENVAYFPSYEIVTGSYARGSYFGVDLREVTDAGVAHVMKLFMQHYAGQNVAAPASTSVRSEARAGMEIVCDEEAIEV